MITIHSLDIFLIKASYWIVIGLVLLIPTVDRSVNAMVFLLAVVVTIHAFLNGRKLLGSFDKVDWCMIALLLSALLSTIFGWPSDGFQGVIEGIAYLTLFICIRHSGYSPFQLRMIGVAIICGVLLGILVAGERYISNGIPFEFVGVTGTIRSSLYLGITLMLCIGFAIDAKGINRIIMIGIVFIFSVAMFMLASRAVIVALLISLCIGLFARYRWRAIYAGLLVVAIAFVSVIAMPQLAQERIQSKTRELTDLVVSGKVSNNDLARIEYWNVAKAWISRGENVLFGIGPRNYYKIDAEQLLLPEPLLFSEETRHPVHAHNMYITRYVEQGLFGLVVMLALFILMARVLIRDGSARQIDWSWWGALGGLLLPGINGLVGSPWYREYSWLAVLTYALYLACRHGMNANAEDPDACPCPR